MVYFLMRLMIVSTRVMVDMAVVAHMLTKLRASWRVVEVL